MATRKDDQLSLSEYLRSATQPELEDFELRRLSHALELREKFATLFPQKKLAAASEEWAQALAEAKFARMLIEDRPALPEQEVPRESLIIADSPTLAVMPPTGNDAQLAWERLEQLVQHRVYEVLGVTNPGRFLEPEFRPQALVSAAMERQTVWDRRKHSAYFQKWGCRQCERKDVPHFSNGYCRRCFMRVRQRYDTLKRQWEAEHPMEQVATDPKNQALKRFIGKVGGSK